ncbi:MAG TPA: hypothetical protein P5277_01400 [Candidatus Paceibacterota bacterium]|nr:hypothetical protein [Candidatus Paceibacterota bacterium]
MPNRAYSHKIGLLGKLISCKLCGKRGADKKLIGFYRFGEIDAYSIHEACVDKILKDFNGDIHSEGFYKYCKSIGVTEAKDVKRKATDIYTVLEFLDHIKREEKRERKYLNDLQKKIDSI